MLGGMISLFDILNGSFKKRVLVLQKKSSFLLRPEVHSHVFSIGHGAGQRADPGLPSQHTSAVL
jgi:hypothetical protein